LNEVNDESKKGGNDIEKKIQDDFRERANNIPEKMMESFSKRATRAAHKIMDIEDAKFTSVAYAIFTGYCLGFVAGNIKKLADEIDKKNNSKRSK